MSSIPQGGPNASWLDEELRRQKAIIAQMRDLIDKQQVSIADQGQRVVGLEDRLAKTQAQLARIPEVEEALRHTRDELVLLVSDLRQDQQKRESEFVRNRQVEREQDVRAMQSIKVELERFGPIEQAMTVRQAEEHRLNEIVLRQQQEMEELARRLAQREEANRQLLDRIEHLVVKVGQSELAIVAAAKQDQEHSARIALVETTLPKHQQQLGELQTVRAELSKRQDEVAENQRRADRERAQVLTEWGRRLESFAHQLDTWADQLRYFTDQHEKNRRILRDVQELAGQVSKQQDQLRQTQRIAEEQLRREFQEWRGANDRHWIQEAERRDKAWEAQNHKDDGQEGRIGTLEEWRQVEVAALSAVNDRLGTINAHLLSEIERLRKAQVQGLQLQAAAAQGVLANVRGALGEAER
jgi:chromosome segregation ATPase